MKFKFNKKIISLSIAIIFVFFAKIIYAAWDGQPFSPGTIDNPGCLPSQVNCDVLPSLTSEIDPLFMASSAFNITEADISNYSQAYNWGNHALAGYVTGTPWTTMGYVTGTPWTSEGYVTGTPWTSAGYLTSYTETDPTIFSWAKASTRPTYTATDVGLGNVPNLSFSGNNTGDETNSSIQNKLGLASSLTSGYLSSTDWTNFNNKQIAGNYLTSYTETDPLYISSQAHNISSTDITNLANLSGLNTGDESSSSIKTKLGITTLSGSNTGDQDLSGLIPYTGATTNVDLGLHNLTVDTNSLFVDSVNHRVGMGITTPSQKLDLGGGNIQMGVGKIMFGGYTDRYLADGWGFRLAGTSTRPIQIYNTSLLVGYASAGEDRGLGNLLVSGNTGIGTNTPTNILSLGGTAAQTIWMERNTTAATAGKGLTLSSGGAIAGTADLAGGDLNLKSGISTGLGTSALHFFTATAGLTGTTDNTPTEKMTILGNGNVGIGTTSPSEKLSIIGGAINVQGSGALDGIVGTLNSTNSEGLTIASLTDSSNKVTYNNYASRWQVTAPAQLFQSSPSGAIGTARTWTNRLSISTGGYSNNDAANTIAGDIGLGGAITNLVTLAGSSMVIKSGNVGIGTTTPTTGKLVISDTALAGSAALSGSALDIKQTWNTTGTPTAFKLNVTNTASGTTSNLMDLQQGGATRFKVDKDGNLQITPVGAYPSILFNNTSYGVLLNSYAYNAINSSLFQYGTGGVNITVTSGTSSIMSLGNSFSFAPTSGAANYIGLNIPIIINQTGGANGITRGLYVNPTLTSAADFRAIEITNNLGMGIYQRGTAKNIFMGSVGLGTTSPTNILSFSGTSAQTIWMERNTTAATAGQGLTLSSGGAIAGTADLAGGDLNLQSGIGTGTGSSAMHFFTATGSTTGTTDNTPTEKMTILGNGSVGIGTTTPGAQLDITVPSNSTKSLSITGDGSTGKLGLFFTDTYNNSSARNWAFGDSIASGWGWDFMKSTTQGGGVGTLAMRLDNANGNLGVGSTFSGTNLVASKLSVAGNTSIGSTYAFVSAPTNGLIVEGNVGIGTATPTANLQVAQPTTGIGTVSVSGTAVTGVGTQFTNTFNVGDTITVTTTSGSETKAITTITSDTVLVTAAFTGTASSGTAYTLVGGNRFAVKGNGNVGIGTLSPSQLFSVGASNQFTVDSTGNIRIGNLSATLAYTVGGGLTIANSSVKSSGSNDLILGTPYGAGTTVFQTGGVNRARIDTFGNFGIGTTTQTSNLQVAQGTTGMGTVTTAGTISLVGVGTQFTNTFNIGDTITVSGETIRTIATITDDTHLTVTLAFSTSASTLSYTLVGGDRFAVKGNGNVGIGTLSPLTTLDVNGITNTLTSYRIGNSTVVQASGMLMSLASSYNFKYITIGNPNALTTSISYGNFGIGTAAPTNILSLGGTTAQTIWMERNTTAGTAGQGLTLSSGGAIAGTADLAGGDLNLKSGISTGTGSSSLRFFTATAGLTGSTDNTPTEKMTILGNGNVGIGTSSPSVALEVAGTVSTGNRLNQGLLANSTSFHSGSVGTMLRPSTGDRGILEIHSPTDASKGVIQSVDGYGLFIQSLNTLPTIFDQNFAGSYVKISGSTVDRGLRFSNISNGSSDVGLGRLSAGNLQLTDGATGLATLFANNIGLGGTSTPRSHLEITATGTPNTNADIPGAAATFVGSTPTLMNSTISLESNDVVATSTGGVLGFGGRYNGTQYANWASIKGLKYDGVSGNYGGYLSFFTRTTGSNIAERMRIDTNGNVGIGTTSPSTILEIGSSDLGNGLAGPILTLGRNTNATNSGAGSINFIGKGGTAGYVWQDAGGNLRINTSTPTNANDTAGTVIGAQTSERSTKQDIKDYTDYSGALAMVTNAPLHTFRYIKEVNGYGTDSPLAKTRIGYIADEVDPAFMVGNVIDQVSVNGILMASVKELNLKLEDLATPIDIITNKTFAERFYDKLIAWLGNKDNGLEKICVKKSDGSSFCVNGDQLEKAVNGLSSETPTPIVPPVVPVAPVVEAPAVLPSPVVEPVVVPTESVTPVIEAPVVPDPSTVTPTLTTEQTTI